jgi:hypothetical protein
MIRLGSGSGRWTLVRTGSRLGLQAPLQKQQSFTRLRLAVADDVRGDRRHYGVPQVLSK